MFGKPSLHLFLLLSVSWLFSAAAAHAETCPDGSIYCCNKCHTEKTCSHASCDSCHGDPPTHDAASTGGLIWYPAPTGSASAGAHLMHATTGTNSYNFSCGECHYGGMQDPPVRLDDLVQIGFKSSGTKTFDGRTSLNPPFDYTGTNGTAITRGGTLMCSNTYCHSDGTSVSTGVVAGNASPAWDSTAGVECNSCHGNSAYSDWRKAMPNYEEDRPKSNSHWLHAAYRCNFCHYTTTTDALAIADKTSHVNAIYDVVPDTAAVFNYGSTSVNNNFIYAFDSGGGTCRNISCHALMWGTVGEFVWGGREMSANISYTYGSECYQVLFSASIIGDGSPPHTYLWDFGDGQTSTEEKPAHVYAAATTYTVNLTVRDANGNRATAATTVTPRSALNQGPTADKQVTVAGYTVTLTDLSTDPDSESCGRTRPGKVSINWTMGSETRSVNLSDAPSNEVFTRTYPYSGTYTIRHSVTDNGGLTASSANVSVTVPSKYSASGTVTRNGAGMSSARINFYKPDGSFLKYVYTNSTGGWSVTGLIDGVCHDVVPVYGTYTFTPASRNICGESTNVDFVAN